MTNDQLVELVQEKSPEELTVEEIELLRDGLSSSLELQRTLREQLQMETYLADALGRVNVTVDQVMKRARKNSSGRPMSSLTAFLLLICVLGVLGGGGTAAFFWLNPPAEETAQAPSKIEQTTKVKRRTPGDQPDKQQGDDGQHVDARSGGNDSPKDDGAFAADDEPKVEVTVGGDSLIAGNLVRDTQQWGTPDEPVVFPPDAPSEGVFEVEVPESGRYELNLLAAARDPAPLRVSTADSPRYIEATVPASESLSAEARTWSPLGVFELRRGKNRFRLTSYGELPLIARLRLTQTKQPASPWADDRPRQIPEGPWQEDLQRPPRPLAEVATDRLRDEDESALYADDLDEWFEPVKKAGGKIDGPRSDDRKKRRNRATAPGTFKGVVKLKAPWPEGAALRFSIHGRSQGSPKVHFFGGERGLSIYHFPNHQIAWAAYETTRQTGAATPETFHIAANDGGRDFATILKNTPTIEIRRERGQVLVLRGDVVVLQAALPFEPEEIYLESGSGLAFYDLELVRAEELDRDEPPHTVVYDHRRPAQLQWNPTTPEGSSFAKSEDGSVVLTRNKEGELAWAATRLPLDGPHMVEVQLEHVTAGTGIFLGREKPGSGDNPKEFAAGYATEAMLFFGDQKTGRLIPDWAHQSTDKHEKSVDDPEKEAVLPVSGSLWVRLLAVPGMMRSWVSVDGRSWAALPHHRHGEPGYTHLGIRCGKTPQEQEITVRRIRLRRLDTLSGLAPQELVKRATPLIDVGEYGRWLAKVTETQPEGVDLDVWRRACALAAIGRGCSLSVFEPLVDALFQETAAWPAERRYALLYDLSLLYRGPDSAGHREFKRHLDKYRQVALGALADEATDAFGPMRRAMMRARFGPPYHYGVFDEELIRRQTIKLLYERRWQTLADSSRSLRYFYSGVDKQVPVFSWAEAIAARHVDGFHSTYTVRQKPHWERPFVEEVFKDAYNLREEFTAALRAGSYQDAVRMITEIRAEEMLGLLPDGDDPHLHVSFHGAVQLAIREHPELTAMMNDAFGARARLRIRRAIAHSDVEEVRLATVRYAGTSAISEAYRWLGDRALTAGHFAQALAQYRRAEVSADADLKSRLAPRIRLAGAMMGYEFGRPVETDVQIGATTLPAKDFEALVKEMVKARSGSYALLFEDAKAMAKADVPPPSGFEVHERDKLDGPVGHNSNHVNGHVRNAGVDWVARQLATVVVGDDLYVSNRFQVACYDLRSGKRKWQFTGMPHGQGSTHDWPMSRMRPVIAGDRIFCRQLSKKGPLLVCLNRSDGKLLWHLELPGGEFLISDPVFAQHKLLAFTVQKLSDEGFYLRLSSFDTNSGRVETHEPLLRMTSTWWQRRMCEVTSTGDTLIASLGGMVVSCDLWGQIRWARTMHAIPTSEGPTWVTQAMQPPLLVGQRLFVVQPSVHQIECLSPLTGRQLWAATTSKIEAVIGAVEGLLVVRSAEQLIAFDQQTGEVAWRREMPETLHAAMCGDGRLLITRKTAAKEHGGHFAPQLVWIDSATGKPEAETALASLHHPEPFFGPVLSHGGHLWAFYGQRADNANRQLMQLTAKGKPEQPQPVLTAGSWRPHVSLEDVELVRSVLPGWKLYEFNPHGSTPDPLPEADGVKNAMVAHATMPRPVTFVRRAAIPKIGRPRLRFHVGNPANHMWQVEVWFNGRQVGEREFNWNKEKVSWKEFEIDLSEIAGQTGWLVLRGHPTNPNGGAVTWWKNVDLLQ